MRVLDYIFFLRPLLFFPAWSSMLLYYILCHAPKGGGFLSRDSEILLEMLAFAFLMAASFILNQLADIETDRINEKLFFLPQRIIKKRDAFFLSTSFTILGLYISYSLSLFQFLLGLIFFVTAGILYNFKPFRMKQNLIGGFIANILMGALASLFTTQSINEINVSVFMLLAVLNTIFYVWTTIPDKVGDLESKKTTIGNTFSVYSLNVFNMIIFSIYLMFIIRFPSISLILICTMIISLIAIFLKMKRIEFWIKVNLLVHGLCVSVFYVDYFLMMISIYLFAKWYYKKRFNFDYPNLR